MIDKANVGNIFEAALEHRATTGPEAELQAHYHLAANVIPLTMLETRAVTPAPGQVAQNQSEIIPGIFPMSCAAFLAVDTPTVPVGDAVYPVLTTNADAGTPAENATQAETTGAFSASVLTPSRIQASFFYSREDQGSFQRNGRSAALELERCLVRQDGPANSCWHRGPSHRDETGEPQRHGCNQLRQLSQRVGLWPGRWHLRRVRWRSQDRHGRRDLRPCGGCVP